jgi:hypothetical protein
MKIEVFGINGNTETEAILDKLTYEEVRDDVKKFAELLIGDHIPRLFIMGRKMKKEEIEDKIIKVFDVLPEKIIWIPNWSINAHRRMTIKFADEEIVICGYKWCTGNCNLPKLMRTREDGTVECAAAMLGVSHLWSSEHIRSEWNGEMIEVPYDGEYPNWI